MRRNLKQEYNASMDQLRFSRETKEDMVALLMSQSKEIAMEKKHHNKKRLLLVALAAALALVTLTGAAAFTRWSDSMQAKYNATQKQKEQAEEIGLSAMLETTAVSKEILSATDQGITITAVQSIVDKYTVRLTFRMEGFDLPEGEEPSIQLASRELINGVHSVPMPISFYDGTTKNEKGEQVYADGTPLQYDSDGNKILNYINNDGSMEFSITLTVPNTDGNDPAGKWVNTQISAIGTKENPTQVEGSWTLNWILSGYSETRQSKLPFTDDNTGITLLETEISPISVCALFKVDNADGHINYYEADDPGRREAESTAASLFVGFRTKDGVLHFTQFKSGGFRSSFSSSSPKTIYPEYRTQTQEEESLLIFIQHQLATIIDPEDVDALVLLKSNPENKELWELTEENFHIVPIG